MKDSQIIAEVFLYICVFTWFLGLLFIAIGHDNLCIEEEEEENNIQEHECV